MELQQRVDLNIGGSTQSGVEKASKIDAPASTGNDQDSAFKDHLEKQVNKAESSAKEIKSKHNQEDKAERVDDSETDVVVQGEADGVQGEGSQSDSKVATAHGEDASETGAELQPEVDTNAVTAGLNTALPEPVASTELPQPGKSLPLEAMQATGVMQQQAQQVASNTPAQGALHASVDKPELQLNQLNTQRNVEAQQPRQQVLQTESDLPVMDTGTLRKQLTGEKPVITSTNVTPAMTSEMKASEAIVNSARLQQVPHVTSVSSLTSAVPSVQAPNVNPTAVVDSGSILNPIINSASSLLSTSITAPVQSQQWSQQMTEQVSYMLRGGVQQAEIRLNPAHLGPMEVKLTVNDDKASINFVAQHAPVRDAIDSAIPRLKEMLEEQGLNLSDVDVSTQSEQYAEDNDAQNSAESSGTVENTTESEGEISSAGNVTVKVDSGLSIYA